MFLSDHQRLFHSDEFYSVTRSDAAPGETASDRRYLGAILNLVPGIGLGYLLEGRKTAFWVSVGAWVGLLMFGQAYFGVGDDAPLMCEPFCSSLTILEKFIQGVEIGALGGFLFISIPTMIHQVVSNPRKSARPSQSMNSGAEVKMKEDSNSFSPVLTHMFRSADFVFLGMFLGAFLAVTGMSVVGTIASISAY